MRRIDAMIQQGPAKETAEAITPHLADESRLRPQASRCHGHIGRRAAGIGREAPDAFLLPLLGQIDQYFSYG